MPEQIAPEINHEFNHLEVDGSIYASFKFGNELAKTTFGFDIRASTSFDHPELTSDEVDTRVELIEKTAVGMAMETGLSDDYFKDVSNVVLLNAIADSWITNKERAGSSDKFDERIGREREMLVDVLLMLAGDQSSAMKIIAESDPELAAKFIAIPENGDEREEDDLELFYDSVTNIELTGKVANILFDRSDGNFLEHQRQMLGIDGSNEQVFAVRVLNIGDLDELRIAGAVPDIEWPKVKEDETDEERASRESKVREAMGHLAAEGDFKKYLKDVKNTYNQDLKPIHGDLPAAFVRHRPGEIPELFIQLLEAHALVNTISGKGTRMSDEALESTLAFVRHEYAHTQKGLFRGHAVQLGLVLEERKAELVSGDKQGYADVKYMFTDFTKITGVKTVHLLEEALKEADPLSTFLVNASNVLGLRNTLLLMATKPLPYENDPGEGKRFADLKCLIANGDGSTLDIAIRETLDKRGDKDVPANLKLWVDSAKEKGFYDGEYVRTKVIDDRESRGLSRLTPYILEAIENERKVRQQA